MGVYADVIVPLAVQGTFTYSVPETMGVPAVGSRVLVPFGRRKMYTAIVVLTHSIKPTGYEVKEIAALLDSEPVVRHPQLKHWQWIADYYLCSVGEVYKAAVPSGLKIESETFISVNPDVEESHSGELSDRERVVLDFTAQRGRLMVTDITRATGFKNVEGIVSRLLDRGAVIVAEKAVDNYKPKTVKCVRLQAERGDEEKMHLWFDRVSRFKKQEQLLLAYLDLSHWLQRNNELKEVTVDQLLQRAEVTNAVLQTAIKNQIFEVYKKEVNRFNPLAQQHVELPKLSAVQQRALGEIHESFRQRPITLLHGVTSSGKTSIYMHLIADAIKQGLQVLYLVPEIALTTQLTGRLHRVFGDRLLIYHSKFTDNERVDIWKRVLTDRDPYVVIGARSAVFLPFARLGLVIVDEEHDTSYKQQDPAPRYNGRNAALVLARMHGAKTLLGSATPSIESYYNATHGKYGLVTLAERYEGIEMPAVEVLDTKQARKKHEMKGMFSQELVTRCRHALKEGEQVILFQNRRGYAPMVRCNQCAWVPTCENCDVSLTYHRNVNALSCHYCGHTISLPTVCPVCGEPAIEIIGYGTERIENDIDNVFPDQKISRMDLDTTRSRNSYERIIEEFSSRKTSILVGTQMVTKGLDFDGVSIVGILNADAMIRFPDFRSSERAFNMLEQVAGRSGRAHKRGLVLVQTSEPDHPVIEFVARHDYNGFYTYEIAERERFLYPPFVKIINIYLKHKENDVVGEMAVRFSNMLRGVFGSRVLGPEAPFVARVQNWYIRQIMLKIENVWSMPKVKAKLRELYEQMLAADTRMKSTRLYFDVDPM
ncbi:MAG: primosomal protein N' [Muribaculaceae bacterium]|nr:primosomal protein N' [Muribaculaceae bacterium]